MPYRFFLIVLTLLAGLHATGQPAGPNPVVVGMLRATVEFLASDTTQFKGVVNPVCQPCQDYEDLIQFAAQNKLMGVANLIGEARRVAQNALETDPPTMPDKLRQFLLDRVINDPKRSYRVQLAGYTAYQQQLDALANQTTNPSTTADELVPPGTPGDTGQTDAYEFTLPPQPTETSSSMNLLPILALLLSALSLAGVIVLWFRKPVASSPPPIVADDKINGLHQRISELEGKNRQLKSDLEVLRQSVSALSKAPVQSQRTNQPVTTPQQPASQPEQPAKAMATPAPAPPRPAAAVPPAAPPVDPYQNPTLLYGRTADLGDGFSVRGLLQKPDRDTVFEILKIDATHATFQVSDELTLQKLALSDAYSYLNDTCIYDPQKIRSDKRIRTEKPGQLSLQGEKWVITGKAQISFLG